MKIATVKMVMLFFLAKITMPAFALEPPGPFSGNWSHEYSCDGATGVYADRCKEGDRDVFQLNLTQEARQICGFHVATGQLGNKVDEGDLSGNGPSIFGTVDGNVATIHFRSTGTGEVGEATLTLTHDTLIWHVLQPSKNESWIPNDAVLNRADFPGGFQKTECATPSRQ